LFLTESKKAGIKMKPTAGSLDRSKAEDLSTFGYSNFQNAGIPWLKRFITEKKMPQAHSVQYIEYSLNLEVVSGSAVP
jgi:hypothetical protein